MGFYEEISEYYDVIFPIGIDQLEFLSEASGKPPRHIIDIACGTGGYSVELAKKGYSLTAVDIDRKMVEETRRKAAESNLDIDVILADMATLSSSVESEYDLAFCIGNSLVHLGGVDEINIFLKKVKSLLKRDGSAVFQIINYDRIIEKGISELPTIMDGKTGLTFTRLYSFEKDSGKILFNTILKIGTKVIENTIPLFPLISTDFLSLIKQAGFTAIDVFGDFRHTPYDSHNSYMLVIKAS